MIIKAKKIINNKVITQSGQPLGKVVDFEVDTIGQNIIKYHTREDLLSFLKESLIIDADQIIEIKNDKIIVKDTIISQKISEKKTTSDVEYVR